MTSFPDLSGKTVLQVIPDLSAGGAEQSVLEVSAAIIEAGGRALIASQGGRLEAKICQAGGEILKFKAASKNPFTLYRNIHRLKKIFADFKVDLIHARSRAPAWSAYYAARQRRLPFVTTHHGSYSARFYPKKVYNSIMVKGDTVIANSDWVRGLIETHYDIPAEKIVTIPRGVDLTEFDPAAISSERITALRQYWGLPNDSSCRIIFLPARYTSWKGQSLVLQALASLKAQNQHKFHVIMAGDMQGRTQYFAKLEKMHSDCGLTSLVNMHPHCTDMPAALKLADIVLAPSLRPEAFGRTAIEAGAMECPVITADHGGARETVLEGRTGLRFTPGCAQSLAIALETLIQMSPDTRRQMGQAARTFITQEFSIRRLQKRVLKVYADLLTVQSVS